MVLTFKMVGQKKYFSNFLHTEKSAFRCRKSIVPASKNPRWKCFHYCCNHVKVKVVRNQVYRRSKVVLGVLRLSTCVVGYSAKKWPISWWRRKVRFYLVSTENKVFRSSQKKTLTFLTFISKIGPFLTENPTTEVYNTLSTPGTTLLLR